MKQSKTCLAIVLMIVGMLSIPTHKSDGCFAVSRRGVLGHPPIPIEISGESAVIVWDAENKIQHFIRKASFETAAKDFGFLVPTPTKPELSEAKDAIFARLMQITAPKLARPPMRPGHSLSGGAPTALLPVVTVIESKQVAGFDAVILKATDANSLNEWLGTHEYESSEELVDWLKPYVEKGWFITAFKIEKEQSSHPRVGSTAVRMSFQTDRPYFPYREPAPKKSSPLVADDVISRQSPEAQEIIRSLLTRLDEKQKQLEELTRTRRTRTLKVFYLADRPFKGTLENATDWPARTVYANQLSAQHRDEMIKLIEIDSYQPPNEWWLTEFVDSSVIRSNNDVIFSPVPSPRRVPYAPPK